jgi:transposase
VSTKLHLRTDGHRRLKQVRRVATRDDKRARNHLAWVALAAAVIWL